MHNTDNIGKLFVTPVLTYEVSSGIFAFLPGAVSGNSSSLQAGSSLMQPPTHRPGRYRVTHPLCNPATRYPDITCRVFTLGLFYCRAVKGNATHKTLLDKW
jgi:hypothetical protein